MKRCYATLLATLAIGMWTSGICREVYVSKSAGPDGDGSSAKPFQSLNAANIFVKSEINNLAPNEGITIHIGSGTYREKTPLVLTGSESGTADHQVEWKGEEGKFPTIDGGITLSDWSITDDYLWESPIKDGAPVRQFYVNGQSRFRAGRNLLNGISLSWEKHYLRSPQPQENQLLVKDLLLRKVRQEDHLEFLWIDDFRAHWLPVKTISSQGTDFLLTFSGDSLETIFSNNQIKKARLSVGSRLENSLGLISPGEWYYDVKRSNIVYKPLPGEKLESFTAEIPVAQHLLVVEGKTSRRNLVISGLQFRMSTWENDERSKFMSNQAGANWSRKIPPGIPYDVSRASPLLNVVQGAIRFQNSSGIIFTNNIVASVGGSGISITPGCQNIEISDNIFCDLGAEAIVIGNPTHPASSSETPVTGNITLTRNMIRRPGSLFPSCPAITAYYVTNCKITSNDIAELPYSGISLGWGWKHHPEYTSCRDNLIAENQISDFMKVCRDGGGIYTLGPQPGSIVTRNYIHSAPSKGVFGAIYHDQGSAYFRTEYNVIQNIGSWLDLHDARAIKVNGNFTTSEKWVDHGVDCEVNNTQTCSSKNWPEAATRIMNRSGISVNSLSGAQHFLFDTINELARKNR